jgi:hypothetical protein
MNRFDQPSQTQFVNTYTPIPFEQIAQAAMMRQNKYDVGQQQVLQQLSNIESMSGATPADKESLEAAKKHMLEVVDKYAIQDYSHPEVQRQIWKDVRSKVDPTTLSNIQKNVQSINEYKKLEAQLGTPQEFLKDFSTYSSAESGLFSGVPEKGYDYRIKEETYFDDLKANKYLDPTTGEIKEYINDSQITRLAKAGKEDYARSAEGEQRIRAYRIRTGDYDTPAPDLAYQFLVNTGQEKKYNEVSGFVPGYAKSKKDLVNTYLPTSPSEVLQKNISIPIEGLNIDSIKLNDKGEIERKSGNKFFHTVGEFFKTSGLKAMPDVNKKIEFTQKDIMQYANEHDVSLSKAKEELVRQQGGLDAYLPTTYKEYKELGEKQKIDVDNLINTYPSLQSGVENGDLTIGNALQQIKLAKRDLQNSTINLVEMSNLANVDLLNDIVNNKMQRTFVIMDGQGVSEKSLTRKGGVLDELGYTEAEFDKYLLSEGKQLGGFTQDGPEPGMYYIEVPTKKGNSTRRVLISSNDNIKNSTSGSYLINQMVSTMGKGVVRPELIDPQVGKEVAYYVDSDIQDGQYKYNIKAGYIDNDNFIPFRDVDITEIKQNEREAIMQSDYLGTNINQTATNKVR